MQTSKALKSNPTGRLYKIKVNFNSSTSKVVYLQQFNHRSKDYIGKTNSPQFVNQGSSFTSKFKLSCFYQRLTAQNFKIRKLLHFERYLETRRAPRS